MKKNKHFLYDYINAYSPVAQETEGQRVWVDYITPYCDEVHIDAYGTAYGIVRGTSDKKVVIEAHCDEIAWMVTHVQSDGLIKVKRHGGSDNLIAPSMPVIIHTHSNKKVNGVFGCNAVHVRKDAYTAGEKAMKQEDLWIDVGVSSKEEANKLGVEVGCLVTFESRLRELGDYYVGKSLDNKIGGYIIAEALRKIKENGIELPYDLYVVNSVQEEVGLFGARMIAKKLQADLSLIHDVCHSTNTPGINPAIDCDVKAGEGPCLEYTAQNHRGILNMLKRIAKNEKIQLQDTVGSYGNDTMAFFLENTPTAILSTPLKHMHTTVEMAHKSDVKSCIKMFVEVLKDLSVEDIEGFQGGKLS